MTLSDHQRQLALEGKPVEIVDGKQTFYLLSKQQYDELQRIRSLFGEIEEIEFSPYEADDIDDPNESG
ncbi:MAG TPA: hypothetical protein VGX78_03270 [Pirellulales bacterium]|jgi:hypothetical protein|nr:hypothetical protein [Pirellulales bacterium]